MGRFKLGVLTVVILALTCAASFANVITIVQVTPTLAPNAYGSPSWSAWQANAIYAIENGLVAYGDPNSPTYYQAQSDVTALESIVTGFPSWEGLVGPATAVGSAYGSELGNRMTFGVQVVGNGTQFSISQLAFSASSSDPYNALGFSYAAGGYNYSAGYVGINYGADRLKGTADDVYITSGSNTQLVDELVGRGSGNSLDAYCSGCTLEQQQQALLDAALYFTTVTTFTGTYSIVDGGTTVASGSGTFNIHPVPEPATLSLLGLGLVGLASLARRKK